LKWKVTGFSALTVVSLVFLLPSLTFAQTAAAGKTIKQQQADQLTDRLLEHAFAALRRYDYRIAVEKSDYILKRDPKCGRAYLYKGYALYKLEKLEEAIIEIRRIYHILVSALQDSGRIDEAVQTIGEALKIYPFKAVLYKDRGIFLSSQKKYDKAITDFTMLIKIEPGQVEGYYNRGRCYLRWRKPALALPDLEKAISFHDKEYVEAYAILGEAHTMIGRPDLAKKDYELSKKYGDEMF